MLAHRSWTFSVRCETPLLPGEVVCVTGSCSELGEWKPGGVVKMNEEEVEEEEDTKR